jgi:hypothetical protein
MKPVRAFGIALLALALVVSARVSAGQDKTARGTVVTMTADSLTVKVGASDMKFTIDSKTTLVASGAGTQARRSESGEVKLADFIKTGQPVMISYRETGSTMYATRVERVSSAGSAGSVSSTAPSSKSSNGTVKSVAAGSLTVTTEGKDMTFLVDANTSVVAKGAGTKSASTPSGKITITDVVKAGERVAVTYHEMGTTMHAAEVRVLQ